MIIRDKILNYLTKNPNKEFSAATIAIKLKINPKSASVQLPILFGKNPSVVRKKISKGYVYSFKASLDNAGKSLVPLVKSTGDIPTPAYNIPTHEDSMNLGDMVNKLVQTNQQNQMYKQALGQIASILEQIGIVEGA